VEAIDAVAAPCSPVCIAAGCSPEKENRFEKLKAITTIKFFK